MGFYFVNKLCEMTIQRHRRISKDTETDKFLPRAAKLTQSSTLQRQPIVPQGQDQGQQTELLLPQRVGGVLPYVAPPQPPLFRFLVHF